MPWSSVASAPSSAATELKAAERSCERCSRALVMLDADEALPPPPFPLLFPPLLPLSLTMLITCDIAAAASIKAFWASAES